MYLVGLNNGHPANTPIWVPCGFYLGTGFWFDEGNVSGVRMGTEWANRDDNIPTLIPVLKCI